METKFYSGNYSLGIGQPFVILSIEKIGSYFLSEKYIIFEAYSGKRNLFAYRTKYPNVSNRSLEDFLSSEIQVCKDDVFHRIVYPQYHKELEEIRYNLTIELLETNETILAFLRDRYPNELTKIENTTYNDKLKNLIKLYKSIVIERLDYEDIK